MEGRSSVLAVIGDPVVRLQGRKRMVAGGRSEGQVQTWTQGAMANGIRFETVD
jgi:hypothetical protein